MEFFKRDFATSTKQKGQMKTLHKTFLCLCLLIASAALFTGCRTAHGFGEDMENAGESIQGGTK
jgi:predicted small secreted protein